MPDKIRVAIVGTGGTARRSTAVFAQEPDAELVALADPAPARRDRAFEGVEDSRDSVKEYDDYKTMLDECELDAVFLGLPTFMHAAVTEEMLERGLHVICEKPPTNTAAEIARIAKSATDKKRVYMFVRQERFTPALQHGRQLVRDGALGEVYYAETRYVRCRWSSGKGWRHDKDQGGGVLLDLGIHAIDAAWFVMGCPRPVEVSAALYCKFTDYAPDGVVYTADDAATGMIRFENGCMLHFMTAFSLNFAGREATAAGEEEADAVLKPRQRVLNLYGTKAGLENGRLAVGTRTGVRIVPNAPGAAGGDAVTLQAREFLRAIRENDEPLNSADQAVMLMQILEGAVLSSETGRAVRLEAGGLQ